MLHVESQVDNDQGDRSTHAGGAVYINLLLLLILELVKLLSCGVEVLDISVLPSVIDRHMMNFSYAVLS